VHQRDGLVQGAHTREPCDGSEDLVPRDPHIGAESLHDGGSDPVALRVALDLQAPTVQG